MKPVCGISMTRYGLPTHAPNVRARQADSHTGQRPAITLGNWVGSRISTRLSETHAICRHPIGVTILFDGYLTTRDRGVTPAEAVLNRYLDSGIQCANELRGSYVVAIHDARTQEVHVINDRKGSRPVFYITGKDGFLATGPEVGELARYCAEEPRVAAGALCQFLLFGSYYDEATLFRDIRKLPPGSVLTADPVRFKIIRYWRANFSESASHAPESELAEECDTLLRQSVRRLMNVCATPFIFLSGGIDSRLLLGALVREGYRIPVATYGTEQGDDRSIAASLAERLGLELHQYRMGQAASVRDMIEVSLLSDARAEMIDSAEKVIFVDQLASRFASYFQGDKSFDAKPASSIDEALKRIGILTLSNSIRLNDWLRSELRNPLRSELSATVTSMVQQTGQTDLHAIKDVLYLEQRVGNRQNGYAAAWLRSLEQARPWFDEDLMDFFARIPSELRINKEILKQVDRQYQGSLQDIPYASRDSIPVAKQHVASIKSDQELRSFIQSELIEGMDSRIAAIISPEKIGAIFSAYANDRPLPPISTRLVDKFPGFSRLRRHKDTNDVHPVSMLFRLLQLHLYLKSSHLNSNANPTTKVIH